MYHGAARSAEKSVNYPIQQALALLEKTAILLETLLRGLPEDLLHWKPAPERWSIAEVLGHLADIEQLYADRTRRMVTEDMPRLQRFEPAKTEGRGDAMLANAAENLEVFHRARRATLVLLRSIPPDSGERRAVHSELGEITLREMLHEWASHDLGHLRQIAELYRAHAFHPHAGPFRKYSNIKP